MRIDERAPPDVHCERRVTFKTILTTGPSRCGAGFKALLIIDVDECSPLDSVANRHEMVLPKWGDEFQLAWPWCQLMRTHYRWNGVEPSPCGNYVKRTARIGTVLSAVH